MEEYGDLAFPCGEACLWYGKALLDQARQETDQLLFAIKETQTATSLPETASVILKTSTKPIVNKKGKKD